jgi:hypothetical protein
MRAILPVPSRWARFAAIAPQIEGAGSRKVVSPSHRERASRVSIRIDFLMCAAVFLGIALRTVQYLANRSLWNDESALALNIIHRHVTELASPLDFGQAAPIGFLVVERLVTDAFGYSEYAFRLFPLICGLVSLPAFAWLARRILTPKASLFAMLLFALAGAAIYYSSEAKPYEGDVAATVVLLAVGVIFTKRPLTPGAGAAIAGVGVAAVIFSFAAVFVVAAIVVALVARWGLSARQRPSRIGLAALAPMILVSLGMVAFALANTAAIRRSLGGSSSSFLGASPHASPWHAANLMGTFVAGAMGLPQGRPFNHVEKLALLLALIGAASLLRRETTYALMLVLPPILVYGAAALHEYPLLARTQLFLVPIVILLIAEGISWVLRRARGHARLVLACILGGAVAAGPVWAAGNLLDSPKKNEELRPVLAYVRDHWHRGDLLYVHWGTQYSLLYYEECGCLRLSPKPGGRPLWPLRPVLSSRQFGPAAIPLTPDVIVGRYQTGNNPSAYLRALGGVGRRHRRVWMVDSHLNLGGDKAVIAALLNRLSQLGTRVAEVNQPRAHAYLFRLRRPRGSHEG